MRKDNHKKGFTLVELLVVIAIIALLSTMAVVALSSAREKARNVKRVADVKQIVTSLELYNNDANGYPVEMSPVALGEGEAVGQEVAGLGPEHGDRGGGGAQVAGALVEESRPRARRGARGRAGVL